MNLRSDMSLVDQQPSFELTRNEARIVAMLSEGMPNAKVAVNLGISPAALAPQLREIRRKLDGAVAEWLPQMIAAGSGNAGTARLPRS